jgi:shikimate dehydrogenase
MHHYAVLGNPISHSKSPLIHRLFAEQTNQSLTYNAILVEPGNLAPTLNHFQSQQGHGINITHPFKQEATQLVNKLSDRATQANAINTIIFNEDGTRWGDNTDGIGLIRDLVNHHRVTISDRRILILGAGGAARGIIGAILAESPAQLMIANRTESKAIALADTFQTKLITASPFSSLKHHTFDIVINATSASLHHASFELPNSLINENSYCYDLAYGKGLTPFLTWAKQQGATYHDGIGMLIEQAAESFFLWRKVRPDTQKIRSHPSLIGVVA